MITISSYDALQYPILFWRGEDGDQFNIKMKNPQTYEQINKKISAMNYYSNRFISFDNANNHIVDMYAKINTERLLFM